MFDIGVLMGVAGLVFSKNHKQLALSYLFAGLALSAVILSNKLYLASIIAALSAVTCSIALILFGGEMPEK